MTDKTDSKERAGQFTKKPVTIDAWLIDFGNKPLPDWVNEAFRTEAIDWCPAGEGLYINTLEGHMLGANGSWLIKGVQGELYACKPDIFAATYERASLAASAPEGITRDDTVHGETYFTAADMATAAAQGFRDGVASVAAGAGSEPVAGMNEYGVRGYLAATLKCWHRLTGDEAAELVAMTQRLSGLYTNPSPPEGMVGGWQDIATAPKDSGYILLRGGREQDVASGYWLQAAYAGNGAWIWPFVHMTPRFWAPLPPVTSAGSGKGE